MWTRLEVKDQAKSVLRKYYWQAFIVSIVLGFATGGSSGGGVVLLTGQVLMILTLLGSL